jgi:hypothetical protein
VDRVPGTPALIKAHSAAARLDQPLIIRSICPDKLIINTKSSIIALSCYHLFRQLPLSIEGSQADSKKRKILTTRSRRKTPVELNRRSGPQVLIINIGIFTRIFFCQGKGVALLSGGDNKE